MTIMQSITDWLRGYPGLSGRLDVDALDDEAECYSVDTVPCQELVKRYLGGDSLRQFQFVVASRRFYDQNIAENLENLGFFEELCDWIEERSRRRELPELGEGKTAVCLTVTSNAYPFTVADNGTARYQIQLRLEYYEKGER